MNKKMIRLRITTCLLLLLVFRLSGQETPIDGIVRSDSTFLQRINVLNLSTMEGSVSDRSGKFRISAKRGDSVLFSSLVYVNRTIVVDTSHVNSQMMEVYLEPDYEQLEAVTIDSRLKIDYGNPYLPQGAVLEDDATSKRNAPDSRRLTDPTSRFLGADIFGILRNLTRKGRIKRKKERQEVLRQQLELQRLPQKMVNIYGERFFTEWLAIPQEEIFRFLDFCVSNGLEGKVGGYEMQLVDFLLKQSKEYLALSEE
jgi:hypothetical protein